MHWFVLGIIGLTLVVSASRYPRLAYTLLVVLLAVAVITFQLNLKNDERSDSLISDSEVELSQVTMTSGYAGSYDMKGILRNDSLVSSIVEVVVQIEMLDCPTQGKTDRGNCNGLGWATARITKDVPPGQEPAVQYQPVISRIRSFGLYHLGLPDLAGHRATTPALVAP